MQKSKTELTAIIATANRPDILKRTLESIANQSVQPSEILIIDGSTDNCTKEISNLFYINLDSRILHYTAIDIGAAIQREQGMRHNKSNFILFLDDDIILFEECLKTMFERINSDERVGGINAMIVNQKYLKPSLLSKTLFRFMHGKKENSYAGKCIGPALNLLPEDKTELPDFVEVEWLNSTCTLYRKEALPSPVFDSFFYGYSIMEDLTLSLKVGKNWKLLNSRNSKIFHDSQQGSHKNNLRELSKMALVNRHYVMVTILKRIRFYDFIKLYLLELILLITSQNKFNKNVWVGKFDGIKEIIRNERV